MAQRLLLNHKGTETPSFLATDIHPSTLSELRRGTADVHGLQNTEHKDLRSV